jgi:hypothetical protein
MTPLAAMTGHVPGTLAIARTGASSKASARCCNTTGVSSFKSTRTSTPNASASFTIVGPDGIVRPFGEDEDSVRAYTRRVAVQEARKLLGYRHTDYVRRLLLCGVLRGTKDERGRWDVVTQNIFAVGPPPSGRFAALPTR